MTSMPEGTEHRRVTLTVNSQTYEVDIEPRRTLADVLRDECGLTGTHLGCEQGVCGACTVLIDGSPARSCLLFAAGFENREITTVEGREHDPVLAKVQQVIIEEDALQCGFCTPGFVVLLTGLIHMDWKGDESDLAAAMSSNICRCTGYQGLMRAARRLLEPTADSTSDQV